MSKSKVVAINIHTKRHRQQDLEDALDQDILDEIYSYLQINLNGYAWIAIVVLSAMATFISFITTTGV